MKKKLTIIFLRYFGGWCQDVLMGVSVNKITVALLLILQDFLKHVNKKNKLDSDKWATLNVFTIIYLTLNL